MSLYKVMPRTHISRSKSAENFSSALPDNNDDTVRRIVRPLRLGHLMAFNIQENNDQISGFLSMEFDYYSYDGSIKYRDMRYSDRRLIKYIEGNPRVMKNIDSYLRKNLLESEYGFKL